MIKTLQNQVNSLQQKVMHLEAKLENSKYVLSGTLDDPEMMKSIQQENSTLKPNMGSYLQENDTKINPNLPESHQQGDEFRNEISKSVSEASKMPSDESFQSQH